MLRIVLKICVGMSLLLGLAFAGGLFVAYRELVLHAPAGEMDPAQIEKILGRESPVFFRDGQQRLGVFFDAQHRRYVPYEDLPPTFVNAITAAEDARFFSHFGIDIPGIVRAGMANFKAGRVVQGGSTITQQTAKNLFKRESRSYQAKLKELVYALRLERRYSKEKILEFYANQFYVSGNGHGLGVAAKYYFDKLPNELSLLECAFIAGSVKRPNAYNPFIKKSEEAVRQARQLAHERARYVLDKMLGLGMIDSAAHRRALSEELGFRQGKTVYETNIVMDLVREALGTPLIEQALEAHGIENVATAGLRIITTVDKPLHETALRALRQELSRLDVRLDGYAREAVQAQYAAGLTEAHAKWKGNRWSKVTAADQAELLAQLRPGDLVWGHVLGQTTAGEWTLELAKYPRLQGAALVMRQGAILAMAGGPANRFFNRATAARRTMGSTFKTLLFTAALELGWNSSDLLDNRRNLFSYQGQAYFPRPDHVSPHEQVSMAWTGVQSENLAAVWLLDHLLDHLTPVQFREVAAQLELTPRQGGKGGAESPRAFAARIRDQHGILVHREILEEGAFRQALVALEADFLFGDNMAEYRMLRSLPHGRGHEGYLRQVADQLAQEKDPRERAELSLRQGLLYRSYQQLRAAGRAAEAWRRLLDGRVVRGMDGNAAGEARPAGMFWLGSDGRYGFSLQSTPPAGAATVAPEEIAALLARGDAAGALTFWRNLRLAGRLSFGFFQELEEQQGRELARLASLPPYSMDVLETLHDYRHLVGLRYLIALARRLGVASPLEPVMSFPLGSNVVSLFETVRMYEAMVTGRNYGVDRGGARTDSPEDALAVIDRIESDKGEVLYRRRPLEQRVVSEEVSLAVRDILRNVVLHGTGRQARDKVVMPRLALSGPDIPLPQQIQVPLFGKTGTANRYTNASFIGFVPGLETSPESRLSLAAGTTIGVYVGFDDNQPMTRGGTRLAGAAGALPTWCELASGVLARFSSAPDLDALDFAFNGLELRDPPLGQIRLAVEGNHGGVVPRTEARQVERAETGPSILTFGQLLDDGEFVPRRAFQPFWQQGAPAP